MKWLSKYFKGPEFRQGYKDYLQAVADDCTSQAPKDYLTAPYVAYVLYTNWQDTDTLDTMSAFIRTAKLFDTSRAYYDGVQKAFDDVWKHIFIYEELDRTSHDSF